jgi:hypothetical protein
MIARIGHRKCRLELCSERTLQVLFVWIDVAPWFESPRISSLNRHVIARDLDVIFIQGSSVNRHSRPANKAIYRYWFTVCSLHLIAVPVPLKLAFLVSLSIYHGRRHNACSESSRQARQPAHRSLSRSISREM